MEYMESRMQDQIEGAELAREQAMQYGNESAFPVVWPDEKGVQFYGINVRDYFAAKAMQGLMTRAQSVDDAGRPFVTWVAELSYEMADAMLEARAK